MFLTNWGPTFRSSNNLDRTFDLLLRDLGVLEQSVTQGPKTLPLRQPIHLQDHGDSFTLVAVVPGLSREALSLELLETELTLRGSRTSEVPEGFELLQKERQAYEFSRSFTLPEKIDVQKAEAILKDGVLTVKLPKLPELPPTVVEIKAG